MECHVYFDSKRNQVQAFARTPSWIGPDFVLLGTFPFDKLTEPDHPRILEWSLSRLTLLDIPHDPKLTIINYSSHAYWGDPPYD